MNSRGPAFPSQALVARPPRGRTDASILGDTSHPKSEDLFVFLNRRLDRLKLLYWDRDGIAIWMKRLERGTFQRPVAVPGSDQVVMDATDLALLLSGIDLTSAKRRKRYSVDEPTRATLAGAAQ